MLFEVGLDHAIVRDYPDSDGYRVLRWSHTKWVQIDYAASFGDAYTKAMKYDLVYNGGEFND